MLNTTNILKDTIAYISSKTGVQPSIIEKDYYLFMLLKLITQKDNEIMFKGGTSLSKAWGILNRFSEDIDLNILPEVPSTDSHRQKLNYAVYESILELGLKYDKTKMASRREYNTFIFEYNAMYRNNALNSQLKVEAMANKKGKILNATYTPCIISNIIWDYYKSINNIRILEQLSKYGLKPFIVNTQNMDVTFVEKCMSLANRYLRGESERLSRHLYDIYCMWNFGNLSQFDLDRTMRLTKQHLLERTNDKCLRSDRSAKEILLEAILSDFYKNDYENITEYLKYSRDGITYDMCKSNILNILSMMQDF